MPDPLLIKSKINEIKNSLDQLLPLLKKEAREIIDDYLVLHTVERLFQLIVDTAIDINTHIINQNNLSVPNDYQGTFTVLAENKIFPMEFALKISPSVGLRNLIVHKYGKVDIKKMVDDIRSEIGDYIEYIKLISEKFI
ncbi:MAG: HepT-like ribonuclease domain-containing protein [Patescibacteria group bacterium]